ncbi:MAG: Spore coat protein SA [Syntrophorhabdus sp. PtaU1.Bin002]|nr:MAG: Spore coat protein SA [Syntrophorhabdus sp. PtaU1.Bin002]
MRAAEEICRRRPNCHIVITGGDEVRYGKKLPEGTSYRRNLLKEITIDQDRVHFLGFVPYETHLKTLQVSAHVYLTVPFVLSWSVLEAMAAGCVVVLGSATPPVREVIKNGRNGLLFDFFSPSQIADRVDEVLEDPHRKHHLGHEARRNIVTRYEVKKNWQHIRSCAHPCFGYPRCEYATLVSLSILQWA